jgi:hypothetical protein
MIRKFSNNKTKPTNQKIRNATTSTLEGIEFKSKLELYTYKKLLENNIIADYEIHTFILQDKFTFDGDSYESHKIKGDKVYTNLSPNIRSITYTPDFVNKDQKQKFIIEVKGYSNDVFPMKWKMFKWSICGEGYKLYLPSTIKQVDATIELIKLHYVYE